jgi:Ran GTPase-activating protein (RanGAP) involved in mRNA processing and transport
MLASNSASLQILKLAKTGLTNAGSISLAASLSSNKVLSELDLSGNEISVEGVAALTNALSANATLRRLVLNQNPIGDAGFAKLAEFLAANQCIAELHLNESGASTRGLAKLFESIRENSSLNTLSLSRVPIRPEELSILVSAIFGKASPQLQQLDLNGCSLGLIGVEIMANLISRLPHYLHVDLNDNLNDSDAFRAVFQRVQQIVTVRISYLFFIFPLYGFDILVYFGAGQEAWRVRRCQRAQKKRDWT